MVFLTSSFGQVCTLSLPFSELDDHDVLVQTRLGHCPTRPSSTQYSGAPISDELWGLLNDCWAYEPRSRPPMIAMLAQVCKLYPITTLRTLLASTTYSRDLHYSPGFFEPDPDWPSPAMQSTEPLRLHKPAGSLALSEARDVAESTQELIRSDGFVSIHERAQCQALINAIQEQ
jgi:hypothetical protein